MFGFYRVASVVPRVYLADVQKNSENIINLFQKVVSEGAALVVFPELSLSGYSCKDLFFQQTLHNECETALTEIADSTKNCDGILVFGMPFKYHDLVYNVAIVLQRGKILGMIPKQNLPNYKEFNEKRYFVSGKSLIDCEVKFAGQTFPFAKSLIFEDNNDFSFGIEICEDLWSLTPPSTALIGNGAKLICNLAASTEYVGKHDFRTNLISAFSSRCNCAYLLSSAGVGEAVVDSVHAGHSIVAELGEVITDNSPFNRENEINYADIDFQKISFARTANCSFDAQIEELPRVQRVELTDLNKIDSLKYTNLTENPFLGKNSAENSKICNEISAIQANALASRFEHIGAETMVLGISGGLDSTLALLVCCEACKILGKSSESVLAVTMPGFGTSDRTYFNAIKLCRELGVTLKEISIKDAVTQHFKDIEHDIKLHDVTYENSQARERTQILMDLANKYRGIVIGTGDLSEVALGWSTYNGDHMAMYSVNASIPKTLMRYIIREIAEKSNAELKNVLLDIIDTPVSPELLPSDSDGKIAQKTEDIIGPYELHDFFIYHFIKNGATPKKLEFLANQIFNGKFSAELVKKSLKTFIRRFFTQQFKRNCMPEGPKATEISLSARGDWQMPSEAIITLWLKELD